MTNRTGVAPECDHEDRLAGAWAEKEALRAHLSHMIDAWRERHDDWCEYCLDAEKESEKPSAWPAIPREPCEHAAHEHLANAVRCSNCGATMACEFIHYKTDPDHPLAGVSRLGGWGEVGEKVTSEVSTGVAPETCPDTDCREQGCAEHPRHDGGDHTYEQHHGAADHMGPTECRCSLAEMDCPTCDGRGGNESSAYPDGFRPCRTCNGSGTRSRRRTRDDR